MLHKLKLKKPPLLLLSVSNAIKTSGTLSPSELSSKNWAVSIITQLGMPHDSILAAAHDPVQSLLAVSTKDNTVRVFGQHMVEVVFEFKLPSPITALKFVKGIYLVGLQPGSGHLVVLSLHLKQILVSYSPPGRVEVMEADPLLDFLVLGLANGQLLFYDVDRLALTPFRVDNLQKVVMPKAKMSPVVAVQWHPRDIASLLVTYSHCAVVYSIASGTIKASFVYSVPKGAKGFDTAALVDNGGKKKMFGSLKDVVPELTNALWHPNGLHVVTVHRDNTLAFWDANDGTLLQARSLVDTHLNLPGPPTSPDFVPISDVRWVAGADPETTQLVVAAGTTVHVLDFGYALKYSMTSHEKQGDYYALPQNTKIFPVPLRRPDSTIAKIVPIADEAMPYFGGSHNPTHLMLLTSSGGVVLVPYDNGSVHSDLGGLMLPPSLGLVHPYTTSSEVQLVKRIHWYGILLNRVSSGAPSKQKLLLIGGAPVYNSSIPKPVGHNDNLRSVLITGHEGGQVRFLDITRGEHREPESLLQISLKETLYDNGDPRALQVAAVSCSFEGQELLVGLGTGQVVVCKFGRAPKLAGVSSGTDYTECATLHQNGDTKIIDIKHRVAGLFAAALTFLPVHLLLPSSRHKISCLKMSDVGFAAVAYESGKLVVCDISRGPAVIFNEDSVSQFLPTSTEGTYVTTLEFAIQEYGQEGYSSILLYAGTNNGGNLLIFKIVPMGNGGFQVVLGDKTMNLNHRVLSGGDASQSQLDSVIPIGAKSGDLAVASRDMFQRLSTGVVIPGYIVTTANRDIRVLKPPKQKLAHKVIDDNCLSCGVVNFRDKGVVLVALTSTGFIKVLSLPSLSDIADVKLPPELFDKLKRLKASDILANGEIFIKLGKSELVSVSASYNDHKIKRKEEPSTDLLFNETAIVPPRPTMGALQWAKGMSRLTTTEDLTFLIAGPNRKPAKHAESTLAYNISPEANQSTYATKQQDDRGYKAPVRKGTNPYATPTTLGLMRSIQTGIEQVEESINGYATNISETMNDSVASSKRSFYTSAVKSKFGF